MFNTETFKQEPCKLVHEPWEKKRKTNKQKPYQTTLLALGTSVKARHLQVLSEQSHFISNVAII